MKQLQQKVHPPVSWENIAPPYKDHEYFKNWKHHPFRYNSNIFDMVNAWWLIEAATLVYADENFVVDNFRKAGFREVEFFSSGKSTECFVASNDKFAIIAFRGSELRIREGDTDFQYVVADWKTDFDIKLVDSGQGGKVHQGFKEALDEIWNELCDCMRVLQQKERKLWLTGHSLGAALATLAADRYGNVQGLYTFGSPRLGDIDFKNDFYVNTYRFVNNNDIVARVPPSGPYHHVGDLRYIDSNGIIHDNSSRWERWANEIHDKFKTMFNSIGQLRCGFSGVIPDPIKDHIPTLYAIHIWNNISQ